MSKTKWTSDKLLSLTAMLVSVITLIIFIYQTNLMRDQNYISVLPYLSISTSSDQENYTFKLNLQNNGLGPAIIESVKMTYKDSIYNIADYGNEIITFFRTIEPALDTITNVSSATLDIGMAIPPNETYNAMSIYGSPDNFALIIITLERLIADGLEYEIIYKSILEERWRIHNDTKGPEKL